MEKQSFLSLPRIRQAITYVLMCVGLGLLVTLGLQGLRQINDRQVVEGKPYQVLAAETDQVSSNTLTAKDPASAAMESVDVLLPSPDAQPPAAPGAASHESAKNDQETSKKTENRKLPAKQHEPKDTEQDD